MKVITYYRVSTDKQGISGLGLEAQRKSVEDYVCANNMLLLKEYVEIESSKKDKRPMLQEALKACEKEKVVLLIAKLDRLSRSVAFVSKLMESGVEFICVDNPHMNKLMIHIIAAFAEHEREMISARTKAALQAAKKRGVVLGKHCREILSKKNRDTANEFAFRMEPVIRQLRQKGFKTLRQLSRELNRLKIPTYRGAGSKFHPATVFNILQRIAHATAST